MLTEDLNTMWNQTISYRIRKKCEASCLQYKLKDIEFERKDVPFITIYENAINAEVVITCFLSSFNIVRKALSFSV